MNEDDLSQYGVLPSFQIRGHDVFLLPPAFAKIIVKCPFPRTNDATFEQKAYVMDATQSVVNYLLNEEFLPKGSGVGIMVLTKHP